MEPVIAKPSNVIDEFPVVVTLPSEPVDETPVTEMVLAVDITTDPNEPVMLIPVGEIMAPPIAVTDQCFHLMHYQLHWYLHQQK